MTEEAIKKIMGELADAKRTGRHAEVMAGPVADALAGFCRQDGEFAQAVVQGGSFAACMRAVTKGIGSALSDIEAYRRAVRFYFPGAEIRVSMTVDLVGDAAGPEPEPERKKGVVLDLTDFL